MVASYNNYATRHGYSTIQIDYDNLQLIGQFTPRDENTHKGFIGYLKNVLIAGHNGYLQADYNKIVKRLEEIRHERGKWAEGVK